MTTNSYDAGGNQVTTTDPDNFTTTTTYDAMDRVCTVKNPDGSVTSYAYDSGGQSEHADRTRTGTRRLTVMTC